MTDLRTTEPPSTSPVEPPPGPAWSPSSPETRRTSGPPTPPLPPPTAPPRRRQRRWPRSFLVGLLGGAALTALGVGVGRWTSGDDSGAAPAEPTATTAAPASAAPASAAPVAGSLHDLVVQVRPSIVAIHTTVTGTDVFGQAVEGEAAGSGFVLSSDGYIVTNAHVVDGAKAITVALDDGTTADAQLIAADPRADLAVLHVDRTDLTPLPLGDSDSLQVGDQVVAIGNALDLGAEPTVTSGIVSAKDRTITEPNGQVLVDLIQTDTAINPGNSGGPLIDLGGKVVGINTAVAGQGQNIGFAISIKPAQQLIDQLSSGEVPRHALLGVSTRASTTGQDGAEITAVEPGSGADSAGLRAGDLVTGLDDDPVTGPEDLVAAIARHQPGDQVDLTVARGDQTLHVTAVLGAHDDTGSG